MNDTQKLGAYIRARRKELGMTLPDAADKIGVNKGLLSRIENGKGNPCYSTLILLGKALKCTVVFGQLKV